MKVTISMKNIAYTDKDNKKERSKRKRTKHGPMRASAFGHKSHARRNWTVRRTQVPHAGIGNAVDASRPRDATTRIATSKKKQEDQIKAKERITETLERTRNIEHNKKTKETIKETIESEQEKTCGQQSWRT